MTAVRAVKLASTSFTQSLSALWSEGYGESTCPTAVSSGMGSGRWRHDLAAIRRA